MLYIKDNGHGPRQGILKSLLPSTTMWVDYYAFPSP